MTPLLLVLYVDLERAILETDDGRAVKIALEQEHQKVTREIRGREERLRELADPARYDEEAARIQEDAAKGEEALEAKQEALLAPIVDKMRTIAAEAKVVDLSEQPLIDPPKECDVTSWLVRAYEERTPLPSVNGCRFTGVVYVDFDRALAASAAGKAATKVLDAFKEKGQAELDKRQRQLAEMERSIRSGQLEKRKQYELERREVAQLYARHQGDLAARVQETEDQLYGMLRRKLGKIAKGLKGVLFVEAIEDQMRMEPQCEGTDWATAMIDGKAGIDALRRSCSLLK